MKVTTVVGARPQFIKSGPVSRAFDSAGIEETLIHTGQHYDLNMSDVFFDTLGLRPPAHHMSIGGGTHGDMTGKMLGAIEAHLLAESTDALLVYGDTNSTLAGALAASKLHIPVIHIEAGLRSFNRLMPEEVNRVLTDHISTLLFCPTPVAVANLASEGITQGVYQTGDVMMDSVLHGREKLADRDLDTLPALPEAYFLATVHRQENVDTSSRLAAVLAAFANAPHPVVLPIHPRTRTMLTNRGMDPFALQNVITLEPVGYLEMLKLQAGATALLTDSGGVQKEAYILGVPCITLRDETEWVETVETGWNKLVGADQHEIALAMEAPERSLPHPDLYGDGHAAEHIVREIAAHLGG